MAVCYRDNDRLNGRQPRWEGAPVVLDEYAHEALQRTQKSAMNHIGLVLPAVLTDVGEPKALREVEVELNGRALPQAANGIANVDVDFWTIEGAAALIYLERQASPVEGPAERIRRQLPLV